MSVRSDIKEMSCQLEVKSKKCHVSENEIKEASCQLEMKSKRCETNEK